MTVRELIDQLAQYDENIQVVVFVDGELGSVTNVEPDEDEHLIVLKGLW